MSKTIMINKFTEFAEKFLLLLKLQINAKRNKKTKSTLKLLTDKI